MATTAEPLTGGLPSGQASSALASQWRRLTRAATVVAVLTSPVPFFWLHEIVGASTFWSLVGTFVAVIAFRGLVDVGVRRFIPWPSLFGTDETRLKEEDIVNRRRAWYWRKRWRLVFLVVLFVTIVWLVRVGIAGSDVTWWGTVVDMVSGIAGVLNDPFIWFYVVIFPLLFLFNFVILFGPLALIGVTQMQSFEPGDQDWGVRLDDVRGQAEAKEEVRRVVNLWQSGEAFESAGGKRERGLLMLGAPGTGKTMLSKAIATGFNCFAPGERFLTRDGLRTFAETAGTTQEVLTQDGEWAPADIHSFGRQPLVEIELRPGLHTRSLVRQTVHATPDHRWITKNRGTVTDLSAGDVVPFQPPPAEQQVPEAFIRGFGFGDGTLDARGRARIRLCGDKDRRYLPLFEAYGHNFVSYPPSYAGDPLVVFNGGHMADWKQLPSGDEDPAWLASWVEGYLAADAWTDAAGAVVLETQDAAAIDFVQRFAVHAGYMVVGRSVKAASVATNYGPRTAPLTALKLRREGVWRVVDVRPLPLESEVFCAVEPSTGTFTLAGGVLTGNCPFVSMPGSGFAQTFIGMDAVIVRYLAWKAKRLARKWGGQCIVFIDEIDAVGMRRQSLGPAGVGGFSGSDPGSFHDFCFYGPNGALTTNGDLVLETRAWRERLFELRAPRRPSPYGPVMQRVTGIVHQMIPGMMGGMGQLALNQLLVVMDGIGNPRFTRKVFTNRFNTFLDACYVIPRRVRRRSLRLPAPRPADEQIYFIGACNVPIEMLDPALIRPGRMGRHVWFRTPTKDDRLDIFNLYIDKVSHDDDLDRPRRRDEIARITNGYSPAMIEQVCSMALTHAHHEGRARFDWKDLVEAMTTIESGTAVNIEYVPDETRAVAIHEAGHAVSGHVYMKGAESVRLSIRRRGQSLGHHQAREKDERFSSWRSEEMGRLIWTLGAMAAERVFYGENSTGVGADVQSGTARAAWMVGSCGMGPERIELEGRYSKKAYEEEKRAKIMKRFEEIGIQIMNRSGEGGPLHHDPIGGVLGDPDKRRMAAQLLGQAYVSAHLLVEANRSAVEHVADALVEQKEMHGDEVLDLLEAVRLKQPEVDLTDDRAWPKV
jgi:ATP-dependent Zn protease